MSGGSTLKLMANGFYGEAGIYGTLGVASSSNFPGGRVGAISWADSSGNLWLFGGNGYDSAGTAPFGDPKRAELLHDGDV